MKCIAPVVSAMAFALLKADEAISCIDDVIL